MRAAVSGGSEGFGRMGVDVMWSSLKINAIAKEWEPTHADRVLIRMEELSDKTAGGVLLPRSAMKFERYLVGEAGELKAGTKVIFTDISAV
ncbi:hypothetical protein VNO80_27238 [Phaseolus coccineus]|uniref:Uncharacterized protein n=1 Tax=Phaseolus coccineus TaxID=3886 RepID=A0AAN9LG35_PHACN